MGIKLLIQIVTMTVTLVFLDASCPQFRNKNMSFEFI